MIRIYDSPAALVRDAKRLNATGGMDNDASDHWVGETLAETLSRSEFGDTSLVPEAENLIAKLDTQIETPRRIWERAPVGVFCAVPDVLAGLPTPIRRLRETAEEHAPVSVLVVSTSSAGVEARTLKKRGTAILALVLALARVRPVSLWTLSTLDGNRGDREETILATRIQTAPLDLATACYVLTSVGWDRRLCHGISWRINGYTGYWPKRFYGDKDLYHNYLIETFSPTTPDRTLLIKESYLTDDLLTNPVLWLNTQIQRFTQSQEEMAL